MKKLFLLISILMVSMLLFSTDTYALEETNLPTNLVTNAYFDIDSPAHVDYAPNGIMYYSNFMPFYDDMTFYFPANNEYSDIYYAYNAYVTSRIDIFDSTYTFMAYYEFSGHADYVAGVYGAWYSYDFSSVAVGATFVQISIYGHGTAYEDDLNNKDALDSLYVSKTTLFMSALVTSMIGINESWYDGGYNNAIDDVYDNGIASVTTTNPDLAYDYLRGLYVGQNLTVHSGVTNFMNDFEKWIVPAVLLVILLGGFTTIYVQKRRGE